MTDRERQSVVTIAELRALRRSEHAPEALQQRVSRRLARELAAGPRVLSERSAAHRAGRAEPVTQLPHRFSVAFEPHADDDEAGIAFAASALTTREAPSGSSELCIDDVRVTREAHQL